MLQKSSGTVPCTGTVRSWFWPRAVRSAITASGAAVLMCGIAARAARQFCKRVEAEMRQRGEVMSYSREPRLSKLLSTCKGLSLLAGQRGGLRQPFEISGLQRWAS